MAVSSQKIHSHSSGEQRVIHSSSDFEKVNKHKNTSIKYKSSVKLVAESLTITHQIK